MPYNGFESQDAFHEWMPAVVQDVLDKVKRY